MKTLYALGEEYHAQDRLLRERIAKLREQAAHLRGEESRMMQARINGLYKMARECRYIGSYLKRYYEKEDK